MPVRRVCLDHLTLPVTDGAASAAFYRAALVEGLGWRELVFDGRSTFGPEGSEDLILAEVAAPVMPIHVAFAVDDRDAVARFHAAAIAAGGRDNGGPGLRAHYSPGYYAAFVLDPDGHNVEAVFNTDRPAPPEG